MFDQEVKVMDHPMTPWEIILKRFFNGQTPDVGDFCQEYHLDATEVQEVFSGKEARLSPSLCKALSDKTAMSVEFFKNLTDRHQQAVAI